MNKPIKIKAGLAGYYRIVKRDAKTMAITQDTGWFKNLILDNGLNKLTNDNVASVCVVGSGNTPPVATQTSLQALIGSTTSVQENLTGVNGGSPWYNWIRKRYRFAQGVAAGNLSEVGIGVATNNLFSRALIVDGGGSPITITVLATEVLDVWYEMRVYLNEEDVNFQIQIGPVLHDCVLRPSRISAVWIAATGTLNVFAPFDGMASRATAYNGAIGPITGSPSGTASTSQSGAALAYVNNSYQRDITSTWQLDNGNFEGGIDAVFFRGSIGDFQVGFTPPINKDNTKVLTLTFRHSWARHTP